MTTQLSASILAAELELRSQLPVTSPATDLRETAKSQIWAENTAALLTVLQIQQSRCLHLMKKLEGPTESA